MYFYLYREIRKRNNILTKKRNLEGGQKRLLKVNRKYKVYYNDLLSAVNWEIQGCERDLENSTSAIRWLRERINRKAYQLG